MELKVFSINSFQNTGMQEANIGARECIPVYHFPGSTTDDDKIIRTPGKNASIIEYKMSFSIRNQQCRTYSATYTLIVQDPVDM